MSNLTTGNTPVRYRHTQYSPLMALLIGPFVVLIFALMFVTRFNLLADLLFVLFLFVLATFAALTTAVGQGKIDLTFGPGSIRRAIPLSEVMNVRVVTTSPVDGLGVHWWNNAWIYNVYGTRAVEIIYKNGAVLRVGTDEPERFAQAIEEAMMEVK